MDQTGDKDVGQFYEQSEVLDLEDGSSKGLGIARVQLPLEKFQLLHLYAVHFRFGGDPFRIGNVFSLRGDGSHVSSGTARLLEVCESAMDDQVGIAPDRARKM